MTPPPAPTSPTPHRRQRWDSTLPGDDPGQWRRARAAGRRPGNGTEPRCVRGRSRQSARWSVEVVAGVLVARPVDGAVCEFLRPTARHRRTSACLSAGQRAGIGLPAAVEVVTADLTRPDTLRPALDGARTGCSSTPAVRRRILGLCMPVGRGSGGMSSIAFRGVPARRDRSGALVGQADRAGRGRARGQPGDTALLGAPGGEAPGARLDRVRSGRTRGTASPAVRSICRPS